MELGECQVALVTMGPRGYENNDYQKIDLNGNTCVFSLGVLSSTPCVQCTYHFALCIVVGFPEFCVDLWLESGDSCASNLCEITFN